MYGAPVGTVSVSASGYIISSTTTDANGDTVLTPKGTRIFHIHLISGGTATVLNIANGAGGTNYIQAKAAVVSAGNNFDFGVHGMYFPNGAYATVDGNIVTAQVTCRAEQS
jgi:hypothetical protein